VNVSCVGGGDMFTLPLRGDRIMELRHNLCMTLVPYATLWYAFFLEIAIFRNLWCANSIKITGLNRRRVHESVADQIRQAIFGGPPRSRT